MCWMCDHPNATRQDYLDHIMSLVASHCWAVQGVERDRYRPPYAYTVGLTAHDKPELVITGMSVTRAAELLNDVAAHLLHAPALAPGERTRLTDGPLVEFIEVDVPSAHLVVAGELYGPGLRALQMVHADDRDRWPWESSYRGIKGGQPVLGVRRGRPARPPSMAGDL